MTLETTQLGFEYRRGRPVLQGVSVSFAAGGVTGVLGPNGAGKSTLLRLMLGVLRPTQGRVTLDGRDISSMAVRERARRIAYIPQRANPVFGFTVRECVQMGRLAWGSTDQDPTTRALSRTGLLDRADEVFDTLSAGQQQKATVARAIAQLDGVRGPVLLADEPASALDPAHSLQAMSIFRELAGAGTTVVLILHDFALAARYCDAAVILRSDGSVAAQGEIGRTLVPEVLDAVFDVRFVRGEPGLVATPQV